ncbi:hypothetical protein [Rickettsiales endosymbiont of Stachyamoeba lipophora]|uniref:hypothetical protein n=1 Tax=Rickettsiales endosymbiont of Stachyamoeba lipophora TaxID=2486578 RepID=UPI000F64BABA|nr:hypothetical protein [Rickettsiales endosymbiont of Stachyamoeba lipophora]AZL16364.1 hypothetical protein EF513_07485 [Rickettsiales endosymbiont of Stachyamoeba lipophora]
MDNYAKTMSNKLADHDQKGGHGKERHGGHLDEKYIAERIERDGKNKYGEYKTEYTAKFFNEEVEQRVLKDLLQRYENEINDFKLNNDPSKRTQGFTNSYNENIGHGSTYKIFDAGLKNKLPIETNEVTIVFRKDVNNEIFVYTIYPNIKNKIVIDPNIEQNIINNLKGK